MHSAAITFGRTFGSAGWLQAWMRQQFTFSDARLETEVAASGSRTRSVLPPAGIRVVMPSSSPPRWDSATSRSVPCRPILPTAIRARVVAVAGRPRPRGALRFAERRRQRGRGRLQLLRRSVPLGINLVKTNKGIHAAPDCDDAILDDYVRSIRRLKERADYLTLNLSCPNTEMGREFFADKAHLEQFMRVVAEQGIRCPLFLKMSPAGGVKFMETVLEVVEPHRCVSGFIFNLPPGIRGGLKTCALSDSPRCVAPCPASPSNR